MDNRLKEMMEYEEESPTQSKSNLGSVASESLAAPSVADESNPNPSIPQTNNFFDFKAKPTILQSKNNLKTMINKEIFHSSLEASVQKACNKPCLPKVKI